MGIFASKVTNTPLQKPRTAKIRRYRDFCPLSFCQHLQDLQVNQQVEEATTLHEADTILHRELLYTANKFDPLKVVQQRRNFAPGLTQDTKNILRNKKIFRKQLKEGQDPIVHQQLKELTSYARERVKQDREEYWRRDLGPNPPPKLA